MRDATSNGVVIYEDTGCKVYPEEWRKVWMEQ